MLVVIRQWVANKIDELSGKEWGLCDSATAGQFYPLRLEELGNFFMIWQCDIHRIVRINCADWLQTLWGRWQVASLSFSRKGSLDKLLSLPLPMLRTASQCHGYRTHRLLPVSWASPTVLPTCAQYAAGRQWEELQPWGGRNSINTLDIYSTLEYFEHLFRRAGQSLWLICQHKEQCHFGDRLSHGSCNFWDSL